MLGNINRFSQPVLQHDFLIVNNIFYTVCCNSNSRQSCATNLELLVEWEYYLIKAHLLRQKKYNSGAICIGWVSSYFSPTTNVLFLSM